MGHKPKIEYCKLQYFWFKWREIKDAIKWCFITKIQSKSHPIHISTFWNDRDQRKIKVDYKNLIELEHPIEHVLEQSDGQERSKVLFQAVPSEQTHVGNFFNISIRTISFYNFESTFETSRHLPPTFLPTQKSKSRFSTRKLYILWAKSISF